MRLRPLTPLQPVVLLLPAVALALMLPAAGCTHAVPAPPPHVVLVVIDTLRADALGCYGNPRQLTPALDAFAGEGRLYEHAVSSAPWTHPSMASIFSGFFPGAHGVTSYLDAFDGTYRDREARAAVFDDRFTTLAEVLRDGGYDTAGFVANPFLAKEFGFGQGFAHYDASFARNTTPGHRVNSAAIDWLSARTDPQQPLFLYLHYMDPHGPYDAPDEVLDDLLARAEALPDKRLLSDAERARLDYLDRPPGGDADLERHERLSGYREYWVARYEAGVRLADRYLAELRSSLEAQGIWDGAVVMVTSDHGESLFEHGVWDHGSTLYESELHVPWIVKAPGLVAGRSASTVRTVDLMPTLLDLVGLSAPAEIQGRSVLEPPRESRGGNEGSPVFAEAISIGGEQKCVYEDGWKLMFHEESGAAALYDLAGDSGETRNLAGAERGRAYGMLERLQGQVEANRRAQPPGLNEPAELTPEQRERLESLGYL